MLQEVPRLYVAIRLWELKLVSLLPEYGGYVREVTCAGRLLLRLQPVLRAIRDVARAEQNESLLLAGKPPLPEYAAQGVDSVEAASAARNMEWKILVCCILSYILLQSGEEGVQGNG